MKKEKLIIPLRMSLVLLILALFSRAPLARSEEAAPAKDFNISKIVLCDPDDPLCKPSAFFEAGKNMRINVLENFSLQLRGESRELTLYIYDQDNNELLKAYKTEQFIWGPHINDKWLCFLPNTLETGSYRLRIVVAVGYKQFEKTTTFSIRNIARDEKQKAREKMLKEMYKPDPTVSPSPDSDQL